MVPAAVPVDGALFATLTLTLALLVAPLVSVARAVIVCVPLPTVVVFHESAHGVVPVAAANDPLSICTSTFATRASSAAVPVTPLVAPTEAPADGAVIVMVGA